MGSHADRPVTPLHAIVASISNTPIKLLSRQQENVVLRQKPQMENISS